MVVVVRTGFPCSLREAGDNLNNASHLRLVNQRGECDETDDRKCRVGGSSSSLWGIGCPSHQVVVGTAYADGDGGD